MLNHKVCELFPRPQLPKATETTALSGAGFMRLVKNVGQSISKIGSKKSETDSVCVCACVCMCVCVCTYVCM